MLNVISEVLDDKTVSMLNQSIGKYGFFGIMADEATNTKTECILSIFVRFLGTNGEIIKRFLSITEEISKELLRPCYLRLKNNFREEILTE